MIKQVRRSKKVEKIIYKLPYHVAVNLTKWIEDVELRGVEEVRKIPGYHDEPLHGKREGQRSIRLTRKYRAIYEIRKGEIEFIEIVEVNKHEY